LKATVKRGNLTVPLSEFCNIYEYSCTVNSTTAHNGNLVKNGEMVMDNIFEMFGYSEASASDISYTVVITHTTFGEYEATRSGDLQIRQVKGYVQEPSRVTQAFPPNATNGSKQILEYIKRDMSAIDNHVKVWTRLLKKDGENGVLEPATFDGLGIASTLTLLGVSVNRLLVSTAFLRELYKITFESVMKYLGDKKGKVTKAISPIIELNDTKLQEYLEKLKERQRQSRT
jgi:hypothetical protein